MDYEFSTNEDPIATASIALRTVYVLHADNTYDVRKETMSKNLIVLRTLNGMGNIKIEGISEICALPGTLLFARHDDIRHYYCNGDKWDFWWFEFTSNDVLNVPLNTLLQIESVENESADCLSCLELLQKDEAKANSLASAIFTVLIYRWLYRLENVSKSNPHHTTVQKSIDFMKSNLNRYVTIKLVAETVGLCERRFRQVFMIITGIQPKKYMENLRNKIAIEMLSNTPFSINDISESLGYSSQFHFSKAFQKINGMPPSQYRINILGNLS